MDYTQIDGKLFMNMVLAGVNKLNSDKASIDSLNVFPVPDGDTGTNMSLTLNSVARFLGQIPEGEVTVAKVAEQMAYGALMGARGNSGVILSQILGGISKVFMTKGNEADAKSFVEGFAGGVESAYKAVVKPMEGTILTVCREASEYLTSVYEESFTIEDCLKAYLEEGYRSLERTPEILPVLKQAGVVDAGAKGLLTIVEGMLAGLNGQTDFTAENKQDEVVENEFEEFHIHPDQITFQYCTELIVRSKEGNQVDAEAAREYLGTLGDCVLVVSTGDITKVHVHTNRPGKVLEYFVEYGDLNDMKIENMKAQSERFGVADSSIEVPVEQKHMAVVAVSAGEGLNEIFTGLGVDYVITGGQTMNPSTEDFINAIEKVHADHVILLPNNKNIIMAADQAAKMSTDVKVQVVASRTIPQGIAALMAYDSEGDLSENVEAMTESMKAVRSGEVTYAVRDTSIDEFEIKEGQLLGIVEGKIKAVGDEMQQLIQDTLENMQIDEAELVTLYYGEDVTEDDANELLAYLEETYPHADFELYGGAQAVYSYLISVE
ncbi:MAG: DAK2 domain-containing protein [Peptococcaceae bacterium]|nr:DAK2 domain-containing protein [Peptococcaceae bacterium]